MLERVNAAVRDGLPQPIKLVRSIDDENAVARDGLSQPFTWGGQGTAIRANALAAVPSGGARDVPSLPIMGEQGNLRTHVRENAVARDGLPQPST